MLTAAAGGLAWNLIDGFTRTEARYVASTLAARALALVLAVHDPWREIEDSPLCNCSSDIPYRCEDPSHPYYERVRGDPRFASLLQLPPHRTETYAALMHALSDQITRGHRTSGQRFAGGYHLLERLDDAVRGERFLCREISMMLAELVGATGGYARLVALLSQEGSGHVVTELWVEDAGAVGRWVVFDPDYDVWFSSVNGIPLSALDLHRMALERRFDAIVAHPGGSARASWTGSESKRLLLDHYAHLSFGTQANWISTDLPSRHPRRHPQAREDLWIDDHPTLPPLYYRALVGDEARMYFTPCRPWLAPEAAGGAALR
ncbi:MAG: hypothetical protein MUF70_10730 [Myxococcota bacterium]|nr:hypothetical protein [Myxococcota bacterium]